MKAVKRGPVKKLILVLVLLWRLVPAAGQQNPADLILLLDISASMSGSYRELRDYITGPFLKEYLRLGDTFHIISFSDRPRLEIARRIEGQGDLETVIGRMFLLYPLEPGSDIPGALAYLETYLLQLSPSRPKKAVLVSDGETVPELPGPGEIENLIGETKKRLAGQNASFDFVRIPPGPRPAVPAQTRPSANVPSPQPLPSAQRAAAAPAPPVPGGDVPPELPPAAVPEPPAEAPSLAARGEASPAPELLLPRPAAVPAAEPEDGTLSAAPLSPPSPALPPAVPPPPLSPPAVPAISRQNPPPERRAVFFILPALSLLGIFGCALFFPGRCLRRFPARAVSRAANPVPPAGPEGAYAGKPPRFDGRPLMLSLFVEDQNTFIGKRNIHAVKPGPVFTIGGGKSDFLIFLVPVPFRIADLRYEGGSCLLIPRKPKYFPDTGSSPVKDCIGKTIRVVSDKNYELFMRIELCGDPLIALNRLVNAI
jgi:hypothetical protein